MRLTGERGAAAVRGTQVEIIRMTSERLGSSSRGRYTRDQPTWTRLTQRKYRRAAGRRTRCCGAAAVRPGPGVRKRTLCETTCPSGEEGGVPSVYEKSFRSNGRETDQSAERKIDPRRNLRCAKHRARDPAGPSARGCCCFEQRETRRKCEL